MNRLTRRYRVLNKNYEFLEELEKETKEIQIDAIKEFNVFFAKWRSENDDIWNALPTKHQKEIQPPKLEFTSREADEELNSLYKEVAKQTHPDLNENRDEMFIEAKEALEQNNWAKMCNLAELLGIDTPNPTYAMVQRLEHSVKTLERTINEIRLTVIWVWFHEKNVHKRNVIFTDFINHLNQQAK